MLEHFALTTENTELYKTTTVFYVDKYDDLCEEHFKIRKIVPLKKTIWRIILNVFINIISALTINYAYGFSDRLKKFILYSECTLDQCEILGIYCSDGDFYFNDIKKINLPPVSNPNVVAPQIGSGSECFLF